MFGMRRRKGIEELQIPLADIHCHILPNLDDGARDKDMALEMLRQSYEEGIRLIVFTPHVRKPWLDVSEKQVQEVFEEIRREVQTEYPDLHCYLGSEVYFTRELYEEHRNKIRRMNETDYLLVEFSTACTYADVEYAISRLLSDGYLPIIAHIERYAGLWSSRELLKRLKRMGAYLQVNAGTVDHPIDRQQRKQMEALLQEEMIDFVATDAHDLQRRKPLMQSCAQRIHLLCGEAYAKKVCYTNAVRLIEGKWL